MNGHHYYVSCLCVVDWRNGHLSTNAASTFFNISQRSAYQLFAAFSWFFTIDALALIISVVLHGSEPLPAGIFVILATILTTVLAVVVTSRLFK